MKKFLKKLNWKTTAAGAVLIGLEAVKLWQPDWAPLLTTVQTTAIGSGLVAAADAKKPATRRQPKA